MLPVTLHAYSFFLYAIHTIGGVNKKMPPVTTVFNSLEKKD